MEQKVYFDAYYLLITDGKNAFDKTAFSIIISDEEKVFDFRLNPHLLFSNFKGNIAVITPHVEETQEAIFDYANGIVAAGGIIYNNKNEILTIFRNSFWDLPKGKVDQGETIEQAALREVEEETGAKTKLKNATALRTYHCYMMKGKDCIKETYWYDMDLVSDSDLKPQAEENILAIKWMNKADFEMVKPEFHPLIAAILETKF